MDLRRQEPSGDGASEDLTSSGQEQQQQLRLPQQAEGQFINQLAKKLMDSCTSEVRSKFQGEVDAWPDRKKQQILQQGVDPLFFRFRQHAEMLYRNGKILIPRWHGVDHPNQVQSDVVPSERARAAWDRQYSARTAELSGEDSSPFPPGPNEGDDYLGQGGNSTVYKVTIDTVVVALKRVRVRGPPKARDLAELQLLEKMSEDRHRHVVEIIGCYIKPLRRDTEIGLFLWPVAQCDLREWLENLEIVQQRRLPNGQDIVDLDKESFAAFKELVPVAGGSEARSWCTRANGNRKVPSWILEELLRECQNYLQRSFGCIAAAIDYLHNKQMIRHKDLKPAQILLSREGLWVTDFGWSLDVSNLSNSATENGDNITAKYHAPEREAGSACGRSEDVFGLGCIFTEMALAFSRCATGKTFNPIKRSPWSFQSRLDDKEIWLNLLDPIMSETKSLLSGMLEKDPKCRPLISEVIERLTKIDQNQATPGDDRHRRFFGRCCDPETSRTS